MTGNELKTKRNELGLTQEQLAILLHLSVFTVSKWEQTKDNHLPNSRMLELALVGLAIELGKSQKTKADESPKTKKKKFV